MRRPQFTLKTLLWLMVVAAAFLGGMELQKRLDKPTIERDGIMPIYGLRVEKMTMPDGTEWRRELQGWEDALAE